MLDFTCDTNASGKIILPVWKDTVGSGHAALALRQDWQEQMRRCHRELGVEKVRFHAILSDPMDTLTIQMDKPLYSFFNANQIMDFLLEIGMKPFVELSFMPPALSSDSNTVFKYKGNITPPRNYKDWATLIDKLVRNWIHRYGLDEVRQWNFEVWNEPNLPAFWTGGQEGYFHLYQVTVETIKNIDSELRVGGPSCAKNAWIPEFLDFCEQQHLPADFITTHHYPTDAFGKPGDDTLTVLSKASRSVMRDQVEQAYSQSAGKPLFYTEWNASSNPRDSLHDQPYTAAFAMKTVMEVCEFVHGYSFWTFSDIFDENYFPSTPFHGGFGLLNLYNIAKPVYRAFEMMAQVGQERLKVQGSHETVDVWIWRGPNEVHVILNNHAFPRHDIQTETVQVTLQHQAAPKGAWITRIDEDHANPRRLWEAMGKPEYPRPQEVDLLHAASSALPSPQDWKQTGKDISVKVTLPPHAVAMVTLTL